MNELKKKLQLSQKMLDEVGGWENSTPGTALVHRFCNAIKEGKVPSQDDLKKLANALEPLRYVVISDKSKTDNYLRDCLDQFASRLELKRRQGRRKSTVKERSHRVDAVIRYLEIKEELMREGHEEKQADLRSRESVADLYKIGKRSMKNWIDTYRKLAELERLFVAEANAIHEEMKTGSF